MSWGVDGWFGLGIDGAWSPTTIYIPMHSHAALVALHLIVA
jgi:hypothetical protein